ncbi:MAG: GNAT family N-acetyltransferase [Alphaproteobacteria bacterium]|nr:GNAT family N-acetyltransferase [Alphaproteobacteria bacterium]
MDPFDRPLYTARLRLEPVTEEVFALANASVDKLAAHLRADIPEDWRRAGLPLVRRRPQGERWRAARCVAIHLADNRVIGDFRFEAVGDGGETFEIGYSVIPAYRQQGLASEATGRVIDALFRDAGAQLIIAGCDRRNRSSVKTLRRLGFWLDGARGTAFWWRLTADLWADCRRSGERA